MIALALQAVAAFNLVCTGTQTTGRLDPNAPLGISEPRERPITDVYRVDLQTMRWCSGDCAQTHRIHALSGTEVILENTRREVAGVLVSITVDRESGQYSFRVHLGQYADRRLGTCAQAEYSGMPVPGT